MSKRQKILIAGVSIIALAGISFLVSKKTEKEFLNPAPIAPVSQSPIKEVQKVSIDDQLEPARPVTETTTDALTGTVSDVSVEKISIKIGQEEKTFPLSAETQFVSIDQSVGIVNKKASDVSKGETVTVSFYSISKKATTVVIGE